MRRRRPVVLVVVEVASPRWHAVRAGLRNVAAVEEGELHILAVVPEEAARVPARVRFRWRDRVRLAVHAQGRRLRILVRPCRLCIHLYSGATLTTAVAVATLIGADLLVVGEAGETKDESLARWFIDMAPCRVLVSRPDACDEEEQELERSPDGEDLGVLGFAFPEEEAPASRVPFRLLYSSMEVVAWSADESAP